jgi:hypothetical protein
VKPSAWRAVCHDDVQCLVVVYRIEIVKGICTSIHHNIRAIREWGRGEQAISPSGNSASVPYVVKASISAYPCRSLEERGFILWLMTMDSTV